ncbi:MAG: hypothetical protein ACI88H_001420 [Cocleimonas sp.]|jgi:hypothetical protein
MLIPEVEIYETVFSWVTHYHLKVGVGHPRNTYKALFGCDKVRLHPYLPNHLTLLAEHSGLDAKCWLNQHTLYPLFHFFGHDPHGALGLTMLGIEGNVVSRANIPQSRITFPFGHRYCPVCTKGSKAKRGYFYLDIRQQIPGVSACPHHGCRLEIMPCGDYGIDSSLTLSRCSAKAVIATPITVSFAQYCYDVYNLILSGSSPKNLTLLYKHYLTKRGYVTGSGQLRISQIQTAMGTYYHDFSFQDGLEPFEQFSFLGPLLRNKTQTNCHPTKHLIFSFWLFNTDASKYNPISEGDISERVISSIAEQGLDAKILQLLIQKQSMITISKLTGKSRCYIRRVCELNNIAHETNKQAHDNKIRSAVIIQALLGRHRESIAQYLGVGLGYVEQIICNTKNLSKWRKQLAVKKKLYAAINELKIARQQHPDWVRKQIKSAHNNAYFYLYRHARSSLELILPAPTAPKRQMINWSNEDYRLVKLISEIKDVENKSISEIGSLVNDHAHLRRKLNYLPKSKALLIQLGKMPNAAGVD